MKALNYQDLLALIIDLEIDLKRQERTMLESQRLSSKNVEIKKASNADILKMHGIRKEGK